MSTDTQIIRQSGLAAAKKMLEQGFPGYYGSITFNLCDGKVSGDATVSENVRFETDAQGKPQG